MTSGPKTHDVAALLEETPARHFESGRELTLTRGQIATVVEIYRDGVCEIEFADREGRTYAMLSVEPNKLMVLYDAPEQAAA